MNWIKAPIIVWVARAGCALATFYLIRIVWKYWDLPIDYRHWSVIVTAGGFLITTILLFVRSVHALKIAALFIVTADIVFWLGLDLLALRVEGWEWWLFPFQIVIPIAVVLFMWNDKAVRAYFSPSNCGTGAKNDNKE